MLRRVRLEYGVPRRKKQDRLRKQDPRRHSFRLSSELLDRLMSGESPRMMMLG